MAENGGSFSDEIPISFRSMSLQYFEFSKNDFIPASKQEFVYFFRLVIYLTQCLILGSYSIREMAAGTVQIFDSIEVALVCSSHSFQMIRFIQTTQFVIQISHIT